MSNDIIDYPEPNDPNYYEKLYKKKEFYDTKIDTNDKTSKQLCGSYQKLEYQEFLQRFMTQDTGYRSHLLFMGTGTGKTCSAISIAENYDKVIILAPLSVHDSWKNEIIGYDIARCTGNKYMDNEAREKYNNDKTPDEEKNLLKLKAKQLLNKKYKIKGYLEFANELLGVGKSNIVKIPFKSLSGYTIIIDECHNVRTTDIKTGRSYSAIATLLGHPDVHNIKLILASATPMFDKPDEIIDHLGLILLNEGKATYKKPNYTQNELGELKESTPGVVQINGVDIQEHIPIAKWTKKWTNANKLIFMNYFKGYVSYIRGDNPKTFPKRIDKGGIINNVMKYTKVIKCIMSEHQTKGYIKVQNRVKKTLNSYSDAADFVYPDLTSGREGLTKFKKLVLTAPNIGKYSCKLNKLLETITKSPTKGPDFIHTPKLNVGGIPLILRMFIQHGYKYVRTLNDATSEKRAGKRTIAVVSGSVSQNDKTIIINLYNKGLIDILLGTDVVESGINLFETGRIHIMNPHWNLSKNDQIIGRGIRRCSHISLPPNERKVFVYKYMASGDPKLFNELTIDEKMYQLSEKKDYKIKTIERLLKKSAVNCMFFRKYNIIHQSKNGTRECDYQECNYTCGGGSNKLNDSEIDKSTYSIEMDQSLINSVKKTIKTLYLQNHILTLDHIIDMVTPVYPVNVKLNRDNVNLYPQMIDFSYIIYTALSQLINNSEPLLGPYQNKGYIVNQGNMYKFIPHVPYITEIRPELNSMKELMDIYMKNNVRSPGHSALAPRDIPKVDVRSSPKGDSVEDWKARPSNVRSPKESLLKEMSKKNIIRPTHNQIPYDQIRGCYQNDKFKIIPPYKDVMLSAHGDFDQKKIGTGKVCNSYKIKDLEDILNDLDVEIDPKNKGKAKLCNLIENTLIEKNLILEKCPDPKTFDYTNASKQTIFNIAQKYNIKEATVNMSKEDLIILINNKRENKDE